METHTHTKNTPEQVNQIRMVAILATGADKDQKRYIAMMVIRGKYSVIRNVEKLISNSLPE